VARGHEWLVAVAVCLVSSVAVTSSAAGNSPLRSVRRPAGVPSEYVLTPNGFLHPSCVISVRSDEVLGADLVIRGQDGSEHARVAPCAYPRYSRQGTRVAEASGPPFAGSPRSRLPRHPAHDTYDGWLVFFDYEGTIDTGSSLRTQWIVPAPPMNIGDQDIAFFNDFETEDYILQPVLDFSELPGQWAIESENCCPSGNDYQSDLVPVSPGDVIQGTVTGTDCDPEGVCSTWTVTTTDLTTGMSTVLHTSTFGEVVDELNPAVLETYDVTSCDMLPANGEITFYDNVLTTQSGAPEKKPYSFYNCVSGAGCGSSVPASLPTDCGYGGSSSGGGYTLLFGTSPTPVGDAGDESTDAATEGSDANLGGATSSSDDAGGKSIDAGRATPPGNTSGPPVSNVGGGATDAGPPDDWGSGRDSGCALAPRRSAHVALWEISGAFLLAVSLFIRRRVARRF
jgi:hypothetical protein